ncbi:replication factor C subunit 1 [Perkinsela sp. CCAP 1560/4]|nr:replication factor C subunit 1 [Perkinsela sp. CCAP 1560/4]|eukprot:KNH09613.1 replication factor C subunit 1 [Perkinsela sp. CCAP 1560/4]
MTTHGTMVLDSESESESPINTSPVIKQTSQSDESASAAFQNITQQSSAALKGTSFLVTGNLKELSRDEAIAFIHRHGGDIKSSVTSKLNNLVVGAEAGEAKLAKAKELKIRLVSEAQLYELVQKRLESCPSLKKGVEVIFEAKPKLTVNASDNALWSDKYAPKKASDLCYPTLYNKIKQWLTGFEVNEKKGMLVSGPPGIGKTTSVYVVAKELNYSVIELNASNHRSGSVLHDQLDHIIKNQGLFHKKNLLLLDEVDGCEKGGVGEVIKLIKRTRIPIICTCNDHWDQKLRPLLAHVEDLRAQRAPYTAMSSYLQKVLEKEKVHIPVHRLQEMVMANGHDYRSLLNNIQLWSRVDGGGTSEEALQTLNSSAKKDMDISLFDMAKVFFDPHMKGSFSENYVKLRNLYYNSDLIPLFIQENYLNYTPNLETSLFLSKADCLHTKILFDQKWQLSGAHFLYSAVYPWKMCRGKFQSFSPFANQYESGVKFPSALGKGSTIRKNALLCHELLSQGALSTFSTTPFATHLAPVILQRICQPFTTQQEKDVIHRELLHFMRTHKLIRADIDFLSEIVTINSKQDFKYSFDSIPAGTKGKITRDCTAAKLIERFKKTSKDTGEQEGDGVEKPAAKKASASKRKAASTTPKNTKSSRKKAA